MSSDVLSSFNKECLDAIDGMTFFGDPVEKMTAQQLLVVVGHLWQEHLRHEKKRVFTAIS